MTIIILTKDMTDESILTNATLQNAILKLANLCGTLNCKSDECSPLITYKYVLSEEEKEIVVKEMSEYGVVPTFLIGSKEFFEDHEESYGLTFNE